MNYSPIQDGYTFPKGLIFANYGDGWEEHGNAENFELSVDVERDDLPDNRFGVSRTADSQVTAINVTLAMTLRQMTNRNRALAVGGSKLTMVQEASVANVKLIEDAVAMKPYFLGGFDLSNVSVTDGDDIDPVAKVAGTDYLIDLKTGLFQPLVAGTYEVTYDKGAITEANGRLKTGIGGNPDQEAEVIFIGANRKGPKPFVHLWRVRMAPSGARGYISDSDRGTVEIEGTCLIDPAKAIAEGDEDEFAFGYETELAA